MAASESDQGELFHAETHWFHVFKAMIENGDAGEMGPYAFMVYCVIKAHTNYTTGDSYPGHEAIAQCCKISEREVIRALQKLSTMGYITTEKRGRKNHYTLREKILVNDDAGVPAAMASWDYVPSGVQHAVADLKRVLMEGDLAGAKIVNIERLTVNVNMNIHAGTGDQFNISDISDPSLRAAVENLLHNRKG